MGLWPDRDAAWVLAYLVRVTRPDVPSAAIDARLDELCAAAHDADEPAESLFGNPFDVAAQDAEDLATPEEALRASGGGGARATVRSLGTQLVLIALFVTFLLLCAQGGSWTIALTPGLVMLLSGSGSAALGLGGARILASSGHAIGAVASAVAGIGGFVVGIAYRATHPDSTPWWPDAPILLIGAAAVVPGTALLWASRYIPDRGLRSAWTNTQWWRRFRGALVLRGMPPRRARDREREVHDALEEIGATNAHLEFGHPVVFARSLADDDPQAKTVRWALRHSLFAVIALSALVRALPDGAWGWANLVGVPLATLLFALVVWWAWRARPRKPASS
ncbi:MAG: hypothetical protein QM622_01560 [Microbacterium sp.]